jgi:hypothetical protein
LPLHTFCRLGWTHCVALALSARRQDLIAVDSNGFAAIHVAAMAAQPICLALLLRAGASVQQGGGARGDSPLFLAVRAGSDQCVSILLEAGADPNKGGDVEGPTPLHAAAEEGSAACVEALLRAGADPSAHDERGLKPWQVVPDDAERRKKLFLADAARLEQLVLAGSEDVDSTLYRSFAASPLYDRRV